MYKEPAKIIKEGKKFLQSSKCVDPGTLNTLKTHDIPRTISILHLNRTFSITDIGVSNVSFCCVLRTGQEHSSLQLSRPF